MSFRLIEVTTDAQFEKMIPGIWTAFQNPRNALMDFMFPVRGVGPDAVKKAMEECKIRLTYGRNANPVGHYLQVIDDDNDDHVVASACWNFYVKNEDNPFLNPTEQGPNERVNWWPFGSDSQKFTIMAMDQDLAVQKKRQTRPHLYLGMIFTNPVHRRRGAAGMLMDWGTRKADELNVECFLESTPIAVPLYERSKFLIVDEINYDMAISNPSKEWKELERTFLPYKVMNMWRPIGGKHKEGDKYPWE